jgi:hypothetical protein
LDIESFKSSKIFQNLNQNLNQMKNLIVLILIFISFTTFSQSSIEKLKDKKQFYIQQIKSFTDSLRNIDIKISEQENEMLKVKLQQSGFKPIETKVSGGNGLLYKEDNPGKSIGSLNIFEKIKVIGIGENPEYYKVEYKGNFGYVMKSDIVETPELTKQRDVIAKSYYEEQKRKKDEVEANEKVALITKYGEDNAFRISIHMVAIGMTDEMVTLSIGAPKDINRTERANHISEQWVYNNDKYKYLYFEDGVLKTIQN